MSVQEMCRLFAQHVLSNLIACVSSILARQTSVLWRSDGGVGELWVVRCLLLVAVDVVGDDGARIPGADVPIEVGQQFPLLILSVFGQQQLLHLGRWTIVHPEEAVGMNGSAVLPLKDDPMVF